MKKILTALFMMVIVLFGGVMLTGCGGGETGEAVYDKIATQINTMREEDSPFKTKTKNYITSNFTLQNLEKKVSGTTKVDYLDQDELIAIGLNYIEKYYPLAKDFKGVSNTVSINLALDALNEGYQQLKSEYENTTKITIGEETVIYNGFIARYAESARQFSSKVYDLALSLEKYLTNDVKVAASLDSDQPTAAAIEFYIESRMIEVYSDYNDFLMENAKASAGEMDDGWYVLQLAQVKTNLSKEEIAKMTNYFDAIAGERKLTKQALQNFSYYDYQVLYNNDIKAYEKISSLAGVYHNQIEKYFGNIMSYLFSFVQLYLYQ